MKKETIELRHLVASEGKKLTDGIVYVNEVYLAPSEDESKWHEIDEKDVPTQPTEDDVLRGTSEFDVNEYANTEPEE
jgi:hypothetical protein